jgi:hypothetical protein
MTRIREHVRKGAALALLALAIQLAAGFGHVHGLGEASHAVGQFQSAASHQDGQPDDHEGEGCALCAVLNLATTSILPDAPQLALPAEACANLAGAAHAPLHEARTSLFHARAPPLV